MSRSIEPKNDKTPCHAWFVTFSLWPFVVPANGRFLLICLFAFDSEQQSWKRGVTLETLEPTRTEYVQYTNKKKIETTLQNYFKFHGKIMQLKNLVFFKSNLF